MSVSLYQNRLRAVRLQAVTAARDVFDNLPGYDEPQAEPFARAVAPVVIGGQLVAARTTNAYVARAVGSRPAPIPPQLVTGPAARNGIHPLDEYQRPLGIIWRARGEGAPEEEAIAQGRRRLDVLVLADIWLASRAAMSIAERASDRIAGWVRTADASACDLCAAADGTPASAAGDIGFHPGCGCTAEPTTEPPDTAPADPEIVDVEEHDELGALLVDRK